MGRRRQIKRSPAGSRGFPTARLSAGERFFDRVLEQSPQETGGPMVRSPPCTPQTRAGTTAAPADGGGATRVPHRGKPMVGKQGAAANGPGILPAPSRRIGRRGGGCLAENPPGQVPPRPCPQEAPRRTPQRPPKAARLRRTALPLPPPAATPRLTGCGPRPGGTGWASSRRTGGRPG